MSEKKLTTLWGITAIGIIVIVMGVTVLVLRSFEVL